MNLTYLNIVEDISAPAAELKVVWNRPEEFGNVFIHPGDFHIRKKTQVSMGFYVFSFICFLFNMACCFQRWSINNDILVDLVFFPHVKIMGMLVANTRSENIVYQSGFCSSGSINVFTLQLDSSLRHNLLLKTYEP